MLRRNVKFQNNNENADRHLNAWVLRWRPFYTPGDFTVTQFAQIPLKYAALQRLFKCRISKVLAGTPCDRGLPGAISKCY